MEEKWVDIAELDNFYQVSNFGRIKRKSRFVVNNTNGGIRKVREEIAAIQDNGRGYKQIYVSINRKRKVFYVHRLVAKYFISNPSNKDEVNHIDGNKSNNNISNLEWVTRLENVKHANDNSLTLKGEDVWNCKLTESKVRAIKRLFSMKNNKTSQTYLCKKLNISAAQMSRIINGTRWKYLKAC